MAAHPIGENPSVGEQAIESVRRLLGALNRRDLEAIKAEVAADFELHPLVSVWQRTYVGHDGIEDWQRDLGQIWEAFEIHADEVEDVEDEAVLVVGRWQGRSRTGLGPLDGPIAAIVRFAGDKARRADVYHDRAGEELAL
jgi:ketosteroid isomerase-like protein